MAEIGLDAPAVGHRPHAGGGREGRHRHRPAGGHPPGLHPGRAGHRHRRHARASSRRRPPLGLEASPISEILIEKSIAGWKEYELEVMRDKADNCVIVCSIENLDPMGVHTGDSITVAPAQTLSDVEYQAMRDAAFACIRRVGVETGGSNVQFALNPADGHMVIIEMNPRVSRSSALASKATGFPIAKIAARLAVGYTLDEIANDITRKTPASFEPVIDYVVTKIPRWAFEKFPGTSDVLGTQMQSVGEAMAIGRTFPESLQKGLRSLEQGRLGLNADPGEQLFDDLDDDELVRRAAIATPDRPFQLEAALRRGISVDELYEATRVDPWFLDQILMITEERRHLAEVGFDGHDPAGLAPGQAPGLLRRPARLPLDDLGRRPRRHRGRRAGRPPGRRGGAHVQDRRHLRGRVRGRHPVPLLDLRGRGRGAAQRPPQGRHPGLGAQPHRPGHRVRLLLRARQLRPARRRLRDDHGQLQPRDGVDRLRHQRPALLRAAHLRGRHERGRGRAAGRHRGRPSAARRRSSWPASCPAELVLGTSPGLHRPGRGPRALEHAVRQAWRSPSRPAGTAAIDRGGAGRRRPGRLPGADAALLRARRAGHGDRLRRRRACARP